MYCSLRLQLPRRTLRLACGSELTSRAFEEWVRACGIALRFSNTCRERAPRETKPGEVGYNL